MRFCEILSEIKIEMFENEAVMERVRDEVIFSIFLKIKFPENSCFFHLIHF